MVAGEGLKIERSYFLRGDGQIRLWPSLRAESAVYSLRK